MPQIEVLPSAKQNLAPGWAYVPDTGYDPSRAPLNPSAPRRLRASNSTSSGVAAGGIGIGIGIGTGGAGDGAGYDDAMMMDIDGVGVGGRAGDLAVDFAGTRAGLAGKGAGAGAGAGVGAASGITSRQRGALLKRLAEMDRDGEGKDVALPREYTVAGGSSHGNTNTLGAGAGTGSKGMCAFRLFIFSSVKYI